MLDSFEWYDLIRSLAFAVNVYALYILISVIFTRHHLWTPKTIDLWYAFTMWTLTGTVSCLQSIILDRPFTPAFVFLTAASFVGAKAVHSKGEWGGSGVKELY